MTSSVPAHFEGQLVAPSGSRFAIVAARFNEHVVDNLLDGASSGLRRCGVADDAITVVRVPGAWELSPVCMRLAKSGKYDAVIALGTVIRGSTTHYDYVCNEAARGVAAATAETGVPVIFGVLTTETIEQAVERAGTKAGNKGFDAALGAVEMANLNKQLSQAGL